MHAIGLGLPHVTECRFRQKDGFVQAKKCTRWARTPTCGMNSQRCPGLGCNKSRGRIGVT
eukprot:scaffold31_cov334-Pavlova_lutheri.AAC.2